MEMRQLEVFVHIAKNLSFSKTAEEMYLSQPTVSTHINILEKHVGTQLLVRSTKEVSLTKAGLDFLVYAQNILSLREQATNSTNPRNNDVKATIDIIASTVPAEDLLPEIIATFRKRYPKVMFRIDQGDSRQVLQKMSGFRYDFGMVGTMPDEERFTFYPIYDDELVLVTSKDDVRDPSIIRENFADYILNVPFIMRESGSGTRSETENILVKMNIDPRRLNIVAYFPNAHGILTAVTHGLGVSLVPKIAAYIYVKAGLIDAISMNNPLFHRKIYLLHNKELWLSPIQQMFADHVKPFYDNKITK